MRNTNRLDVLEIRHYRREVHEGVTIITYEVRHPGEAEWRPVTVFRPTEPVASEQEVR
jgi:hypothetical protein